MKIKTELIRRKMREQRLTIREAAAKAGISESTMYHAMERCTCNGTTLGKLARFAGVKAYEMVEGV